MKLLKNKVEKLLLLCLLLIFTTAVPFLDFKPKFSPNANPSIDFGKEINNSDIVWIYNLTGQWYGGYGINIDDTDPWSNWSYYVTNYEWVTGSGTPADPYLLKNILIDGLGQETNLITIKNSNVDFRIQDCILYNTDPYYWDETRCNAIYFENVDKGVIENVETFDSMNGIRLKNSDQNIVQRTYPSRHSISGIVISGGSQNKIRNNTISECSGIRLVDGTLNNDVKKNIISDRYESYYYYGENYGISLAGSHYNNITLNNVYDYNQTSGIFMTNSHYNNISLNILTDCGIGIEIGGSNDNIIAENLVERSIHPWYDLDELELEHAYYGVGIKVTESSWNSIIENNVSASTLVGILIQDSDNHTVSKNIVRSSGFDNIHLRNTPTISMSQNQMYSSGLYFYIQFSDLEDIIIESSNLVNNKPIYFYVNETYLDQTDFINAGQIFLYDCENSVISNYQFVNVTTGVTLNYCTNTKISSNIASYNSRWGFGIFNSSKTKLIGNTASYGDKNGITIENSDINYIAGNTANNNQESGISLNMAHHDLIYDNTVNNNDDNGIILRGYEEQYIWNGTEWVWEGFMCYNNTFSSNEANQNNNFGIIVEYVEEITISGNVAKKNKYGIYLHEFTYGTIAENEAISNQKGLIIEGGIVGYISNNTANYNAEYYDSTPFIRSGAGIEIISCTGLRIDNNEMIRNARGLSISDCYDSEVKTNYVKHNGWEENRFLFFDFTQRPSEDMGILISNCYYFNVTENTLVENGLGLTYSDNNTLYLNIIEDFGFLLTGSSYNLISGNLITGGLIAVDLRGGSDYNNITFNIIVSQQCFRERGGIGNVFEGNQCTEVTPYYYVREILSLIGLASVLCINTPIFLKKRKRRKST